MRRKVCKICQIAKLRGKFYMIRNNPNYLNSYCKKCHYNVNRANLHLKLVREGKPIPKYRNPPDVKLLYIDR